MNIRVDPRSQTVSNGAPFTLTTTIVNCAPGLVTLWYELPADCPCNFLTSEGPAKRVQHSGVIEGTGGAVPAILRIDCTARPVTLLISVAAQDSAGATAHDKVRVTVV